MPISAIKYPSINAKLKGMYAKKIKNNDIQDLYKQDNLKSVIAILKNKDSNLKDIDENTDRQQIEELLNLEIIYDMQKIVKYLDKSDSRIFNILISKYEINCIKKAIRLIYSQNKYDENIEVWTTNIFKYLKGLEKVQNFEQLYKILDKTKYKKIIKKYVDNENIKNNIFEIENEFDKKYLKNIYESAGNKQLENMIGSKIDFTNIIWIYRMKEYYKFSEDQIKEFIIDKSYLLSKSKINSLIKSQNIDEMNEILSSTPYSKLSSENIYDLECKIRKYLYNLYKKNFKSNLLSINCIYAYLNLVEMENNDIISIIEAVRYGIDKSKLIKKLLI